MATTNNKFLVKNGLAVGSSIDVINSSGQWVGATGTLHGATGIQGASGISGASGYIGLDGATGIQGASGSTGQTGATGPQGASGVQGIDGASGYVGSDGATGVQGASGSTGLTGATGTAAPYVKKTANYTAVNGDYLIADTSGGAFTITLPASPSTGHSVTIADGASFYTNNLTIARNGSTIEGNTLDLVVDVPALIVTLLYDGTTWEVYSSVGAQGATGYTGSTGPTGATGIQGASGSTGLQGASGATGTSGDRYLTTSSTSFTIADTGSQTVTVGTGLAYSSNQTIILTYDGSNHQHGRVTSYNPSTGSLVFDKYDYQGSGTYASWTVNLDGAVGAQGASGATGPGSVWTRITSNTTAVTGSQYIADTSGGAFTLTLPASPSTGFSVAVADGANWSTNNLTIARNGSTIDGDASDLIVDVGEVELKLIYDGDEWQLYTSLGAAGATGVQGASGSTGLTGSTGPGGATGVQAPTALSVLNRSGTTITVTATNGNLLVLNRAGSTISVPVA